MNGLLFVVRAGQEMEFSEDSVLVLAKFMTSLVGLDAEGDKSRPFVKVIVTGFTEKTLVLSEKNKGSPRNPRVAPNLETGSKPVALLVKKLKEKLARSFKRLYGFS